MDLIERKKIQKSGIIMVVIFSAFLFIALKGCHYIIASYFIFLNLLALSFIIFPYKMRNIYVIWNKIAHFIGRSITSVILSFIYIFIFVPYSIFLKILKIDPLHNPKKDNTYWVERKEKEINPENFKELF